MTTEALPSLEELHEALGPARGALRSRLPWLLGGVAFAVVLGAGLVFALKGRQPNLQYLSAPVLRGDLAVTVASTGSLEAVTSVEVGSEVSGRVIREFVDVNDEVKKGQVLAEIDPEPLDSTLTQAQAQLRGARDAIQQAQAAATESERTLARNQALSGDGILAQADLDASSAARNRDHAGLASARENARVANASLDLASSKRRKATIRAPIDGVVLARLVEQGQTVTAGFQTPVLFKLAQDLRKMKLNVDIDEADVSRIRAGETAVFTVEAYPGRKFPSTVVSLQMQPKVSQNVVTYLAVLSVDNLDRALLPGMTCNATIQAETRKDILTVPNAALRFQPPALPKGGPNLADGRHRVWVLKGKTPEAIEVNLGATDGRSTEILPGALQEGMAVLTDTKTTK
jgi:HlyD family secretion protein